LWLQADGPADKVLVKLSVQHRCNFGEVVKVSTACSLYEHDRFWTETTAPPQFCCSAIQGDAPYRSDAHAQVVGSSKEFGSWDVNAAGALTWSEGDVWQRDILLGPGQYEFKVCNPEALPVQ
jgi:hypothetical protein